MEVSGRLFGSVALDEAYKVIRSGVLGSKPAEALNFWQCGKYWHVGTADDAIPGETALRMAMLKLSKILTASLPEDISDSAYLDAIVYVAVALELRRMKMNYIEEKRNAE